MVIPPSLIRLTSWSHALLSPILAPGDLAVDLTAGRGADSLFLWQRVAPNGRVLAFDIQSTALAQTTESLLRAAVPVHPPVSDPAALTLAPGVTLVAACHGRLAEFLRTPAKAVIANLGYLPGGDRSLLTQPETTLAALDQAATGLEMGGRLVVTVYPGHPGGGAEEALVTAWFAALDGRHWEVLKLVVPNRERAPLLMVAERRGPRRGGVASGERAEANPD